ncbi:MAG: transcriptional regulator with XRE-family HTH domain [Bacteroidia bacterium]|jgi:transcriptional regulator with XRE-family HTH domain
MVNKAENPDIQKLAKRIRNLRIKQGYTNYEYFAYEKGFSRSQYGRYERGEDIRYSSLIRLIKAFDMTPDEFFGEGF